MFGTKAHFQTLYWATGSANYMWMFFFMILFLWVGSTFVGRGIDSSQKGSRSVGSWVGLCFLAFLVGASNENVGVSLLLLFALTQLWALVKTRSLAAPGVWCIQGFIFLGSIFLICAPGNYIRQKVVFPEGPPSIASRLQWWLESWAIFLGRPDPLIFILFLLIVLGLLRGGYFRIFRENLIHFWFVGILAFLMAFVLLGHDGNFYGRKSFNIFLIFGFYLLLSFLKALDNPPKAKILNRVIFVAAFLVFGKAGYVTYEMAKTSRLYSQRDRQIMADYKAQKAVPVKTCFIDSAFGLEDMDSNPDTGLNKEYASYLGVPSVAAAVSCDDF